MRWYKWRGDETLEVGHEEVRQGKVDGFVAVTQADKDYTGMAGYTFSSNFSASVNENGTNVTHKNIPSADIAGSPVETVTVGGTEHACYAVLELYFASGEVTLTLEPGDEKWWKGTSFTTQKARADQLVTNTSSKGAIIPGAERIERPGYTFVGWSALDEGYKASGDESIAIAEALAAGYRHGDASMPAAFIPASGEGALSYFLTPLGATFYAVWRANTTTPYVVKHVRVTGDGTEKEVVVDTEYKQGTTDTEVTIPPFTGAAGSNRYDARFTGWTYAESFSVTDGHGTVYSFQGTTGATGRIVGTQPGLVITLYYEPDNTNQLVFRGVADATDWTTKASWTGADQRATYRSERHVPLPGSSTASRPGYTLVGWTDDAGAHDADDRAIEKSGRAALDYIAKLKQTGRLYNAETLGEDGFLVGVGGATLYAVWSPNAGTAWTVEHVKVTRTWKDDAWTYTTETVTGAHEDHVGVTDTAAHATTIHTSAEAGWEGFTAVATHNAWTWCVEGTYRTTDPAHPLRVLHR